MIPKSGDLKNSICSLQAELRRMKYTKPVAYEDIVRGCCEPLLPILHYALLDYSVGIARTILEAGVVLTVTSDLKFVENVFKIARSIFDLKVLPLSVKQFLQKGFAAEHKVLFCISILKAVQQRYGCNSTDTPGKRTSIPASPAGSKVTATFSEDCRKIEVPVVKHSSHALLLPIEQRIENAVERLERASTKLESVSARLQSLVTKAEKVHVFLDAGNVVSRLTTLELQSEEMPMLKRPSPSQVMVPKSKENSSK